MNIMKKINKNIVLIFSGLILSTSVFAVEGEGLQGTVESGIGLMRSLTILGWSVGIALGLIFLVLGGKAMAKHGEDKREAPIGKIILYFGAGVILLGLGFTNDTMQETLFSGRSAQGGGEGADLGDFGSEYESF